MKNFFTIVLIIFCGTLYAQTPGNALNFDGSNDMVVATGTPAPFSNLNANDFTYEAWVYPTGAVFSRIIYVQNSTTNFSTMSTGGTNNIYFYVVAGGTNYSIATSANLPSNQWTHVACVWHSSTHAQEVYFNGVLQGGVAGGTSSTGVSGLTVLGSRPGGAQYFPGSMDEVRIWSEARTQCQIQSHMNSEFIAPQPNLAVYYKFNQGIAGGTNTGITNLPDINGTFNGTLTNFALTGATSNWITSTVNINDLGPNYAVGSFSTTICANDTFTFGGLPRTISGSYQDTLITSTGCDSIATLNLTVLSPIGSGFSATACDQYTFNSTNLSASGTYYDTLPAFNGCDSIITLNLTINNTQTSSISVTSCDQYMFNSTLLSSSGTYVDTVVASTGCDSIISLNLTINNSATFSFSATACDQYMFNSTLLSSSGTYVDTLVTSTGCDSIVSLNLTINNSATFSFSAAACDQYMFNSTLLTSSGTYMDTLVTASGCDSMVTLNLTIHNAQSISSTEVACYSYLFNGNLLTVSGIYEDTLATINGCDSIVTLDLTINNVDVTVNQTGSVLTSATSGAIYQWLDCNNSFAVVPGATANVYDPPVDGSYALEITQNGCTDTSACFTVNTSGVEDELESTLVIYPNPTDGMIYIQLKNDIDDHSMRLVNVNGELIQTGILLKNQINVIDITSYPSGIYFLHVFVNGKPVNYKVVKK